MCDNSKFFDEKDLQECMRNAIRTLQIDDKMLLDNNCSERAQVHWLAIYFEKELMKKGYKFNNKCGYCIDVEYNRIGSEGDNSKILGNICQDCDKSKCTKRKSTEKDGIITIDMILHRRGENTLSDNVLCVEIKPQRVKNQICDKKRIKILCTNKVKKYSTYQYGLALHLKRNKTFSGVWYHNGEEVGIPFT